MSLAIPANGTQKGGAKCGLELKETHLGVKNSLGGRSTSTSTLKPEETASVDEKMSISSSGTGSTNGISERTW